MVHLLLEPMDESHDMVAVRDGHGTAFGVLHIDTFLEPFSHNPNGGEVYHWLWNGRQVVVELKPVAVDGMPVEEIHARE